MQSVLTLTEGGSIGLGHIRRQIVLARELRRRGMEVNFISPFRERVGVECLQAAGYRVKDSDGPVWPAADALIVDVEEYPGLAAFDDWKGQYPRVILFGGAAYPRSDGENLVDLTVYQGEPFDDPSCENILNGLEYVIVDSAFVDCRPNVGGHIVISMGGRDLFNFTPIAAHAANQFEREVVVIIGPQFDDVELDIGVWWGGTEIVNSPVSLAPYLNGAALCICTTGMTAYEALCAGVPCVLGDISEDHERTARGLAELGVASNIGLWGQFTVERCAASIRDILNRPSLWFDISSRARSLIDGHGVERVAEKIMGLLNG